ncbi:hypothetical protein EUGRSUZ_C03236 [Eucalyptus grandis]|uniref:Uncharacterized protein n=2 Tax=Eucalyptus grandis TaxID=71139 RepID=A0ACC3LIL1_EUCGR|nr:hypothetical protein EUGRSUZ_C03236 [Eucalyptus grandis]
MMNITYALIITFKGLECSLLTHTYKKIVIHLRTANARRFCDFLHFHNFYNSKNNRVSRSNRLFILD